MQVFLSQLFYLKSEHFSRYMTIFELSGVLQEQSQFKKFNGTSANVKQNSQRMKSIFMLNKGLLGKAQLVELMSKAHEICKRKKQEI